MLGRYTVYLKDTVRSYTIFYTHVHHIGGFVLLSKKSKQAATHVEFCPNTISFLNLIVGLVL